MTTSPIFLGKFHSEAVFKAFASYFNYLEYYLILLFNSNWKFEININLNIKCWKPFKNNSNPSLEPSNYKY